MVRFISSQNALILLLLSFVFICNIVISETKASCNQKDKQILLCFKHGLTDPLGMLATWSNKEDCCEWKGVHCDIKGRVTNLSLSCSTDDINIFGNKNHCLTGKFHLSLFELEFLNYLDLSNNDFKAIHLPLDCQNLSHANGNISKVVYLDLSENENLVIGDLRWLFRLSSSLQYLNLNSIDLHMETQWLQKLSMLPLLSELDLSSCQLESASPSFQYANFTSLESLDLSENNLFSELPLWIFNLSGISELYLNQNRFHGKIPETILNLPNLHVLGLSDNEMIGTIPDSIGQLGNLQYLILGRNLLTGSIPTSLGNLSALIAFNVVSNNLTGSLPQNLGNLSNLEYLDVGENFLSGAVTHQNFIKLSNLKELSFGSPFLMLNFDPHWIPPFELKRLILQYTDLNLVPWLYTQTSLYALTITNSNFKNQSQDLFWKWSFHFTFLSLSYNDMPWDMSNVMLNSEIIWLNGNGLRGSLPQLTSNVSVFNVYDNNLSGSLSPLLCHNMIGKSRLEYLDVSSNILSGGLTECWTNWKSLIHVNIGGNNITGMIPHSMGTLSNLRSLNIFSNNLYGEIPVSLKNCQKLEILNLSKNKFFGAIPNWFGLNIKVLQLRSNEFSGIIPPQICQLSSLLALDLANNRLTGTIPHCLDNITAMISNNVSAVGFGISNIDVGITFEVTVPLLVKGNDLNYNRFMHAIDLSNNHLSGLIPSEVFKLIALESLNLSQNHLMGIISEEIGNMKQLESLDLSNNTLSGEIPSSMSALNYLGVLNLSFNNLKGQIPLGTQLQGFTNLSYMGNPELCGTPLTKTCNHNETKMTENDEEGSELMEFFYMGLGVGFATGFWLVFGSLLFKRSWRHAYFNFLYDMRDRVYVLNHTLFLKTFQRG